MQARTCCIYNIIAERFQSIFLYATTVPTHIKIFRIMPQSFIVMLIDNVTPSIPPHFVRLIFFSLVELPLYNASPSITDTSIQHNSEWNTMHLYRIKMNLRSMDIAAPSHFDRRHGRGRESKLNEWEYIVRANRGYFIIVYVNQMKLWSVCKSQWAKWPKVKVLC